MKWQFKEWLIGVGALCLLPLSVYANQEKVYSFGVVPQQSAQVLAKKWIPILNYLEVKTGYQFQFKTDRTIPNFESKLMRSEYDFAYMNPYHFTVFERTSGYQAFAKQGDKQIKGILVVHKDSKAPQSLKVFDGKKLAFPAPAAFAATVIPLSVMKQDQVTVKPVYVSSHESVYKNVAYKNFVAGGGIERTFNNADSSIRDQLKIIWRSNGYTPHAFATAKQLPEAVRVAVRQAMIEMHQSEQGLALLKTINFKKIESANNEDWDDVRGLDINLLNEMQKVSTP